MTIGTRKWYVKLRVGYQLHNYTRWGKTADEVVSGIMLCFDYSIRNSIKVVSVEPAVKTMGE